MASVRYLNLKAISEVSVGDISVRVGKLPETVIVLVIRMKDTLDSFACTMTDEEVECAQIHRHVAIESNNRIARRLRQHPRKSTQWISEACEYLFLDIIKKERPELISILQYRVSSC